MTHDETSAAQAVALEVARRLKDLDTLKRAALLAMEQSARPAITQWRPLSLSQGSAGLAVMFEYLDACFPDGGWDVGARWHLTNAARSAEANPGIGIPLYGGLTSVAFAAHCMSRGGRRCRGLSSSLDEALFPSIEAAADELDATSGGCPVRLFDLISGVTGAGVYLLCRSEQEGGRLALERVLRCLVSLTAEGEGLPRWRTPRHLLATEDDVRHYPDGYLNCGLAHGIPGPLGLMSLARLHGIGVPGMDESIEKVAAWLLAHRVDDHRGVNWPTCHPMPRRGDGDSTRPPPGRAAWCYGSPGLSRALYLAGRALGRPGWCQVAIDAMTSAVTRPVNERMIPSPAFCHGVAGLLQITSRFARDTGLPVFQEAKSALLAQLVEAWEPDTILGFRSISMEGRRLDDPALLDGAAGVCLAMIAATTDVEPTWDRMFLLS